MGSLGHQDHPNDEHNEALALLGANEDLTNTVDVDIFCQAQLQLQLQLS